MRLSSCVSNNPGWIVSPAAAHAGNVERRSGQNSAYRSVTYSIHAGKPESSRILSSLGLTCGKREPGKPTPH